MYELLGICIVLASLMTLNAGVSLVTAMICRLFAPLLFRLPARTRADVLFTFRIAAPALAAIAITVFLVPSYLSYEPRLTSEVVSKKLAALAIISVAGLLFALWRTIRLRAATASLRKSWLASSERIELKGIDIPTFKIDHRFPIIAIVGTLRPRLFVADRVLQSLTPEELSAAITHEAGHVMARDNLKRTLLSICRDTLLFVPFGRAVDRAWADAAESAADEFAAEQSRAVALNLASALVTIAKMVPVGVRADVPVGSYLVGIESGQGVKARIKRLLEISAHDIKRGRTAITAGWLPQALLGAALILAGVCAMNPSTLLAVHTFVERAVDLLC